MKRLALGLILLCWLAGLTACAVPEHNEALLALNEKCEFGGLLLGMNVENMQEKLGEPDAANPTNGGVEYVYHDLDLSVSVDEDDLIRRLSSKNADFTLFDIAVGDEIESAGEQLLANGYTRDAASGWRYNNNEVQVILLTIDSATVIGFSLEWLA